MIASSTEGFDFNGSFTLLFRKGQRELSQQLVLSLSSGVASTSEKRTISSVER